MFSRQPKTNAARSRANRGSYFGRRKEPILPTSYNELPTTKNGIHSTSSYSTPHSTAATTTSYSKSSYPFYGSSTRQPTNVSCNSFLLGGAYYPGKDKKRRVMRKRTLWYRIFCSSPARMICTTICCGYILLFHILIPTGLFLLSSMMFPSSSFHYLYWKNRQGLKQQQQQLDWLLTDTTLIEVVDNKRLLGIKDATSKAESIALEREQLRQLDGGQEFRLDILQDIAPKWFNRNNPEYNPEKEDIEPRNKNRNNPELKEPENDADDQGKIQKQEPQKPKEPEKSSALKNVDDVDHPDVPIKIEHPDSARDIASAETPSSMHADMRRRLVRTLHNTDVYINGSHCPRKLLSWDDIQTTLVVQSSLNRIWVLAETCRRWKDPIIVVVAVTEEERNDQDNALLPLSGWKDECPQLTLILHDLETSSPEEYPVNQLRNIALDAVETSHILVVDVDFVPSMDLHETIRSVLLKRMQLKMGPKTTEANEDNNDDTKEAIVVPAFERILTPPCKSEEECKQYLRNNSTFIPQNFEALKKCVHESHDCIVFQEDVNPAGHSSTRSKEWLEKQWYQDESSDHSNIRKIDCFDTLRYEPYVVLQWCPTTTSANETNLPPSAYHPVAPYYDERFHGYGKNKIEHVSHLRFSGYRFAVLPEGFIVHNPHVESKVKEKWNDQKQSDLHRKMDILYRDFLKELVKKYGSRTVVGQCRPDKMKR